MKPVHGILPTLTEVVQPAPTVAADDALPRLDQGRIVEQVLLRLQQQIDPLLAAQVQAAMAPVLAQALERLLHETRLSLARQLREQVAVLVADAVSSALAHAPGPGSDPSCNQDTPQTPTQRGTGLAG